MIHPKKWFINRIGKRIYRDTFDCCDSCEKVAKEGLVISNEFHARYLFDIQNEIGVCGRILNYRDKLKELNK